MRDTIPFVAYHTAHKPPVAGVHPVTRFDTVGEFAGRLVAFTHDAATGFLPSEYDGCDVLIADLPWRRGFDEFSSRAGLTGRTYPDFMTGVSLIVEGATVPTYLVTGKHALAYLPRPDIVRPMRLNQDDAVAIGYRPGAETFADYGDSREFLHGLAQIYGRVGDFCCGYGRSGRHFLRSGKSAVLSDVNPLCVGYVAGAARGWLSV
jgi:hypothetical protein